MPSDTLTKPRSFFPIFERKPGADQCNTHYCPGCGHGIIHKLIAEAIDELEVQDRTIMIAPVGCTVFLYYYFHVSAVSVPHGRAPASLTGISRAHPDSICISYQGDGDLAAIGTNNILHAANRGEKMVVFFVNNAVYGMTGGQMAPTTLIDMVTTTSPYGRKIENEGHPLRMAEIIASLEAPVFVERTTLADPKGIMHTRSTIQKALKAQVDKKGFCFVEILSPCPSKWYVDPTKAGDWMKEHMHPVFKPGVYKDQLAETPTRETEHIEPSAEELYAIMGAEEAQAGDAEPRALESGPVRYRFAGFGGQGILTLGVCVAQAGDLAGYRTSWLPSYGPEMKGGTANASVILSDRLIGSPMVADTNVLIAMNAPSLDKFLGDVVSGGIALYDSSIVTEPPTAPQGVRLVGIPATQLAQEAGRKIIAGTIMLGAYLAHSDLVDVETMRRALNLVFAAKPKVIDMNVEALEIGARYIREHGESD